MTIELDKTKARQGQVVPGMRSVLVISTVGAFLALALIYLAFPWPKEQTSSGMQQPAPERVAPNPQQQQRQ